jgi:hypothetical protein
MTNEMQAIINEIRTYPDNRTPEQTLELMYKVCDVLEDPRISSLRNSYRETDAIIRTSTSQGDASSVARLWSREQDSVRAMYTLLAQQRYQDARMQNAFWGSQI